MNFIAVDVETANQCRGSICQVGWSVVKDGTIVHTDVQLINPETYFDPFNVSIHGITEEDVREAPRFKDVKETFRQWLSSMPVISYGLFDRAAFNLADDNNLDTLFVDQQPWINGQRIVRRAWPEHFRQFYRLTYVTEVLDLYHKAHDAGSDAKVLAEAIVMAKNKLGLNFDELLKFAYQPMTPRDPEKHKAYLQAINKVGHQGGPLSEENICFTGALDIPRKDAAALANDLGATVNNSVTQKTTILVVGSKGSTDSKSSKQIKAETLNMRGFSIEIISENEFFKILSK